MSSLLKFFYWSRKMLLGRLYSENFEDLEVTIKFVVTIQFKRWGKFRFSNVNIIMWLTVSTFFNALKS